jgi:hypothetical protein
MQKKKKAFNGAGEETMLGRCVVWFRTKMQSPLEHHATKKCRRKLQDHTDLDFDFVASVTMKIQR